MKTLYFILSALLFLTANIFSAPWDTGFIEWQQPDGTGFIARSWGDEFAGWMETDDGYQIIVGPDGYYYYAIIDENGEFTFSDNKVGIDEPLPESYQLERSPERLAEIEAEIEAFNEQVEQNYIDFMAEFDGPSAPPLKLAIVLIDFADDLHSNSYFKSDWDTLFFSTDYYHTIIHISNVWSPDNEYVYGSFRDYYKDQSLNELNIIGKLGNDRSIINPEDPNNPGKPLWVYMPEEKSYYTQFTNPEFMNLAQAEAESQLNIDLDQYDRIGFILAGNNGNSSGGTWPTSTGYRFTSWEKYGNTIMNDETFTHIGVPAHEFAHTLGAKDEYLGLSENDPKKWGLMSYGCYNGGDNGNDKNKSSCPAHFSPAYRIRFNWVTPVVLEPQEDLIVQYDYSSPNFYKINIPGSNEYFIVERRRKDGFDLYTPKYEDPNNPPKGILIWHIAPDKFFPDFDLVQLEPADNQYPPDGVGVRFPLNTIQEFTDLTSPASNKRDGDNSFISIKNIEWIGDQQTGHAEIDYIIEALEITGTETWSTTRALAVPVYIKDEGTLNITNGAYIHFNGDFVEQLKIVVEDGSTLNLTGSENNKVVLLSGDFEQPIRKWSGIEIHGTGILESNYAIIQDASNPIKVFYDNSSSSLNNTEIDGGLVYLSGDIAIENSIFYGASLSIDRSNNGSKIKRTIFSSVLPNQFCVQLGFPDVSYLEVTNCTFDGINYGLIFGIQSTNSGGDWTDQITVTNNIFSNCYKSIYIYEGIVSISYNDFYNNSYNEFMGSEYLTVNPLYVDPENNDFNLQWGSGCIDAGNPSSVYNDPDGTRNDIGAKYYNQAPVVPTNFTMIPDPDFHPFLQWQGAPHLNYNVYALYEYPDSTYANQVYQTLTETYVDETVTFQFTIGAPNQLVTYSVTSINNLSEESGHSEEISIDAYGRIPKESLKDSIFAPSAYNLFNPFPNPFNPTTTLIFDLPEQSFVSIKLFSITGEEVRTIVNEKMDAGRRHLLIDGNGLSSGVYLLRMISNDFVITKKLIMMK